jgi:cysteinyl-tRNA synthetase
VDAETAAKVEALINDRADAKKAKDFAKADAIRDELTAMGVTIVDVKGGVNWSK